MARGLAAILACMPLALSAAGPALPKPSDLRREAAQMAREQRPLVVLYSRAECHWCEQARTYLRPLANQGPDAALIRQIDLDSDAALTGFDGGGTTQRAFAAAEHVRFAPTVVIYGAGGERLGEPIVGMRLPDFYGQYLERAIDEARGRMTAAAPPGAAGKQNQERGTR